MESAHGGEAMSAPFVARGPGLHLKRMFTHAPKKRLKLR